MRVRVLATDRLSAAIMAEKIGDNKVREPVVEYTHAMQVRQVNPRPAIAMTLRKSQPLRTMAIAA